MPPVDKVLESSRYRGAVSDYVRVERTGPAIRAALIEASPEEVPEFEAEFRVALAMADEDFDIRRVDDVLDRWWARAHLRLNPPTSAEKELIEKAARGDFHGIGTSSVEGQP